jgi:hypothetical protein
MPIDVSEVDVFDIQFDKVHSENQIKKLTNINSILMVSLVLVLTLTAYYNMDSMLNGNKIKREL